MRYIGEISTSMVEAERRNRENADRQRMNKNDAENKRLMDQGRILNSLLPSIPVVDSGLNEKAYIISHEKGLVYFERQSLLVSVDNPTIKCKISLEANSHRLKRFPSIDVAYPSVIHAQGALNSYGVEHKKVRLDEMKLHKLDILQTWNEAVFQGHSDSILPVPEETSTPIKTPEQILAEKRQQANDQMKHEANLSVMRSVMGRR